MRKYLPFRWLAWLLPVISIISLLWGLWFLAIAFLGASSNVRIDQNSTWGLFLDDKGLPASVSIFQDLPDTVIRSRNDHGNTKTTSIYRSAAFRNKEIDGVVQADTFVTAYDQHVAKPKDFTVTGTTLQEATLYVQPKNLGFRIKTVLPIILPVFLFSFCLWKVWRILRNMQRFEWFDKSNYRHLQFIGWSIIGVQAVFLIMDLFFRTPAVNISFQSSQADYFFPLNLVARFQNHFDLLWFMIGCVVLVVSDTFREGRVLEDDINFAA